VTARSRGLSDSFIGAKLMKISLGGNRGSNAPIDKQPPAGRSRRRDDQGARESLR
jgi:hypothetical protein